MRRYTPLFLIAFIFLVALLVGNMYSSGYADRNTGKHMKEITVYTSLPVEHAAVLAEEYEKLYQIRVNFVPLSKARLEQRVKSEANLKAGGADVILTDREILMSAAKSGVLQGYTSERTDIVQTQFKDENGAWVGVWYDPVVFCANKDYLKTLPVLPASWNDLARLTNVRIGITDFFAADASANLLYTFIAEYDERRAFDLLRKLHPKVVQYAKYLSTPARMAGMGEVDIAVSVQSESIRYMNDDFPIALIYPSEGTAYMLTGAAILKNTARQAEARQFVHWLLGDEAQMCQQKNRFFFVPTNQETMAYKSFSGKNLVLFDNYTDLNQEQKRAVLDRWIKHIRLK